MMTWLRSWLERHGWSWHAQNLTARSRGPMWQAGRAWFRKGEGLELNPEWHVAPRAAAALGVQFGGESGREVMFHIGVGLAEAFLTIDYAPWRKFFDRVLPGYWFESLPTGQYIHFDTAGPGRLKVNQETEIKVQWHDGGLWWSLWHPTMEWSSKTPKWRHGHFDPIDWLLGRPAYSTVDLNTEPAEVPMPERTYPATVRIFESTWKRPRWPVARRMVRADIEVEGGIPHPGKGENSWDCDDDATYSLTCQARTPEQAVGKLVESVLRDRRRYGGRSWRPREAVA